MMRSQRVFYVGFCQFWEVYFRVFLPFSHPEEQHSLINNWQEQGPGAGWVTFL